MKTVTTERMRELDREATEEYEIPGEELMRRAGRGVAGVVSTLLERTRLEPGLVQMVAGRGNNGGDAFAAACFLHDEEYDVEVLLAGSASEVRGDALRHLGKMRAAGVPLHELPTKEDWEDAIAGADGGQVIVDGLLGLGVKGPPRGPIAGAVQYINAVSADNLVVSIDIPSGLDADTGEAAGEVVIADVTATIGLPKPGLLAACALEYVGTVEVIMIGIPVELLEGLKCERELITVYDVRQWFPRRARGTHKGQYGHVLVIGGAGGYAGAAGLATGAALRSGVGLVSALVPRGVQPVVAGANLEAMVHAGPETENGSLAASAWEAWRGRMEGIRAIVLGPGMTPHEETGRLVDRVLREAGVPVVLDADALNVLAGRLESVREAKGPVVLTPHPGELARLLGCTVEDVQRDRDRAAREAARRSGATVVLKGAGTVVVSADVGRPLAVNLTGNPGMAAGGMGDVLAGLVGGVLAQGLPPYEAACAGVYLHGRAGDSAAWRKSQAGMTASDVIEDLSYVLREVGIR